MQITIPTIQLSAIYPEVILTVVALLVLMLEVFRNQKRFEDLISYVTLGGTLLAAIFVVAQRGEIVNAFSGLYIVDNYSQFFKLVILLGTFLTILISIKYAKDEQINHGEYYSLILFGTIGMMVMVSGSDLMTIFMGIELLSISLYVLAGYTRKRNVSNEASLKYFLLGAFATGFLIYGIALIYGATGSTNLHSIGQAMSSGSKNMWLLTVGMVLLVVGFGFKISIVPFHMWTPDVYEGAPSTVTAFMSAGPKAAGLAAFIRVFAEALPALQTNWVPLLWILAVLTMTVGNVMALRQTNVKRLLAYSSIAHVGYALVGFVSASELGITAVLFYMLGYTFMNIGAFAVVALIGRKNEEKTSVQDYTGIGFKYPLVGLAMVIFLFSLAGIPPTAGFTGKFYLFLAAVKAGYVGLAVIAVLNSVVGVYYYLRITVVMYMREEGMGEDLPLLKVTPALATALVISIYGTLRLGIFPQEYIAMAKDSFLVF